MPWAQLTDQRAYYELRGQGDAALLVSGLGATVRVWDPIRDQLGKHLQLIAADNRGIGGSTSRRRPRHLTHYGADLVELLDHLQVERAHVIGLSLGGIIAQRLAIDHPGRVDRLVLISCSHRFGPYLREMAELIGRTLRHFPPEQFNRALELLSSSPSVLDADPHRVGRRAQALPDRRTRRAIIEQLRCLGASDPREDEYRIAAPTLVVAGQFDGLIPHCYARQMADEIPHSRFELLDGIGHNPVKECPDRLCDLLMRFLQLQGTEVAPSGSRDGPARQAA